MQRRVECFAYKTNPRLICIKYHRHNSIGAELCQAQVRLGMIPVEPFTKPE